MPAKIVVEGTATAAMPYPMPAGAEPESVRASPGARLTDCLSPGAKSLCALVVSSDDRIQQELADIVTRCGLIAFRAFTVGESRRILARHEILLVVSDDRLIDGRYEDLLDAAKASRSAPRVIVVSLTGGWPDYFHAMNGGAFDFLAYPPIRGELARVVHDALEARDPAIADSSNGRAIVTSREEEGRE